MQKALFLLQATRPNRSCIGSRLKFRASLRVERLFKVSFSGFLGALTDDMFPNRIPGVRQKKSHRNERIPQNCSVGFEG